MRFGLRRVPRCACGEIEARLRAARAVRDEMLTWGTPLEEWKKLWEVPRTTIPGGLAQRLIERRRDDPFVPAHVTGVAMSDLEWRQAIWHANPRWRVIDL